MVRWKWRRVRRVELRHVCLASYRWMKRIHGALVIIILEQTVQKRHKRWQLPQHHASDTPSVKREPERAHTHVTHRMCVRTQITWTWLCTRGKKRYKYCSFSHTNRSFRVLGHQCIVTMGNCLIWISLCMFFFPLRDSDLYLPLYDWQTRTVWPKNIKIGSTEEKKTPTSWMPLG